MVKEVNPEDGVIYHTIKAEEDAEQAAEDIWSQLREAHLKLELDHITLIIGIPEGHFNDEGGYSPEMYHFQKSLCLGILPGFVDKLSFPLGDELDTSKVTPTDAIEADFARAETQETGTAKLVGEPSQPIEKGEEAADFLRKRDLKARFNHDKSHLVWGLVERGHSTDALIEAVKE